ncbi:AMP-binding protein [Lentzea sp. NPDC060358]|uniref:AMP-binding protein n=1 Tax=Lentzea sp. NPDC060358 TaxID=3347103 RepID=UPI003658616A
MSTAETVLPDREFWSLRREALAAAANEVADVLGTGRPDVTAAVAEAVRPLPPATAALLARVTGGDPLLRWAALAGVVSLVLRRFGAGAPVVLMSGDPVPAGLPVLLQARPGATFREWLTTVVTTTAEVLDHDRVDGTALRALLGDHVPIAVGAPGENDAAVTLHLVDDRIRVRSAVVPADLLERLAGATTAVLDQGLSDPDRPLRGIDALGEDLRRRVLAEFNAAPAPAPLTSLRDRVLANAATRPDVIAVQDATSRITYRELRRDAAVIARGLRASGVGADDVVAVAGARDAATLVAVAGVLLSGGALAVVDPAAPRAGRVLDVAKVVLVSGDADRPPASAVVGVSDLVAAAPDAELPSQAPAPDDLAYLTAGSAEIVCVDHRSLLAAVSARVSDHALRPGVQVVQTLPLTSHISIGQLFASLAAGATLRLVPGGAVTDPAALAEELTASGRHHVELTPPLIAAVLDHLPRTPKRVLRQVVATEPLPTGLARRWQHAAAGDTLLASYGPAEAGGHATGRPAPHSAGRLPAIGRTLPNARIYLLDNDLQPVPPGVTGELHVGGDGVARGYLGAPAATAAAFLPDPFAAEPGRRMFRTGDRGRWTRDGGVEFVGREDTRTTVRGRRVDLGEVEHVVLSIPDTAWAVVEPVPDGQSHRLVAFVAARPGSAVDVDTIRKFAADRLPPHAVPGETRVVGTMPHTPDGRVDRAALRALAAEPLPDNGVLAPRTETERYLCDLWARYLGLDEVGVDEDFFELGGDSILGIKIAHEARGHGYRLRPRHVLEFRTIEELAVVAGGGDADDGTEGEPAHQSVDVAPLAPAQRAFFARDLSRHDHWNNSLRFPVLAPLGTDRVERAVRLLADRHPALRTRFAPDGRDRLVQRVGTEPPPVTEIDLRDAPAEHATGRMHDEADQLQRSLDLRTGPIGWFALVRTPAGTPDQLLVVLHHAVVDLYSWDVIAAELSALLRDGDARSLPAPTTSFPAWSRRLADQRPGSFDVSYWLTRDWSTSVSVVPSAHRGRESAARELTAELDQETTRSLLAGRQSGGLSTYELLVAALGTAFGAWLGGTPGAVPVLLGGHGREDLFADVDLSRTVGWFTSTYPFLLPLPGDPGYAEHVASELRAVPRNGFDFAVVRHLAEDHETGRRLATLPAPQVTFDFARTRTAAPTPAGAPLGAAHWDGTGRDRPADALRDHAIQVFTTLSGETLSVTVRCSGELVPADRLGHLVQLFLEEVQRCAR